MSLTLRHSHVPGHPPWLQGAPIDAHRFHCPRHDGVAPLAPLLVLTTLRPGTGDALHKAARLAHTLGTGLCGKGCAPLQDLQTTVLFGDVDEELQAHLARSTVGTLVVGHTQRRWWPWAGLRARPLLHQTDDTLVVPLPARSLRAVLRRAWAGLLAVA